MKHRWNRRDVFLTGLLGIVLALGGPGTGQGRQTPSPSVFDGLAFRNIGPATASGRVDDYAVFEKNPAVFYVATATGGLWKTVNNGTTWEVLFDDQDAAVSIGDVAIAPDDPNLVWVGTGENNNRNSSSWGDGVYKSTDGGHTWQHMGLDDTKHIGRVVMDPIDHDVVYVATTGHLWGPNKERGLFKTTDGGLTWTNVLFVNEDTGATDVAMDPANNKVLYAAMYQRRRAVWGFSGGGPGSGLYKSGDAGRTWVKLTNGIPEGPLGRIGLDIYRKNPSVVYATIEHEKESGTYRSDDAGTRWRKMSDLNPRPMYYSQIRVDPSDDHRIYVLGTLLHISDDGGKTWWWSSAMHGDHHAMWVNPANSSHVITGSDGGVGISYDRGRTWDFVDNMDLGQFYHVSYDMDWPYRVYGGLQDNESWGGPSAVRSLYGHYHGSGERRRAGIANGDWFLLGGGDGFVAIADPRDSRILYNESQGGNVSRVDRLTSERKSIKPQPAKGEAPLRWNWNTPLMLSPHAPSTVFIAANRVYRSTDRGHSWTAISPDLTAAIDRGTLSLMGVSEKDFRLSRNDGVSVYGTLVAFAESPRKAGVYYTGADDGTLHVSRDDGKTWTNISGRFPGLPKQTSVSRLTPSAFDEGTVYASFDGHQNDDYAPYVFASTDHGSTWKAIAASLPKGQVVRSVIEDQRNPNVLYLGTEFGLFVSLDKGGSWVRVRSGLPTVPIYEITQHPRDNDLILATHGRSIWILDDLGPFQRAAEAMKTAAYLFESRPATQFIGARDRIVEGDRRFWGKNPEFGAAISYSLKQEARQVSVTIRDSASSLVCELSDGTPKATGINRLFWDLRHERLRPPRDHEQPEGFFSFDPLDGPSVLPGDYTATLSVDGREVGTSTIEVKGDPSVSISDADRKTLHDASMTLHRMLRTANEATDAVLALVDRVQAVEKTVKALKAPPAPVKAAVEKLAKQVGDLAAQIGGRALVPGQPRRLGGLAAQIGGLKTQLMGSTSLPTETQMRVLRELQQDLAARVEELNNLITGAMPAIYKTLADHGVRPALPTPITPVTPPSTGRP